MHILLLQMFSHIYYTLVCTYTYTVAYLQVAILKQNNYLTYQGTGLYLDHHNQMSFLGVVLHDLVLQVDL